MNGLTDTPASAPNSENKSDYWRITDKENYDVTAWLDVFIGHRTTACRWGVNFYIRVAPKAAGESAWIDVFEVKDVVHEHGYWKILNPDGEKIAAFQPDSEGARLLSFTYGPTETPPVSTSILKFSSEEKQEATLANVFQIRGELLGVFVEKPA